MVRRKCVAVKAFSSHVHVTIHILACSSIFAAINFHQSNKFKVIFHLNLGHVFHMFSNWKKVVKCLRLQVQPLADWIACFRFGWRQVESNFLLVKYLVADGHNTNSVCNAVIPPASMPCTTFCFVCFHRPAFCRVCVFILWTSCLLINK